ncbi:hypothetical protein CLU79DRAFT_762771 [Phycomyces nitens]|nr:hypothetical protein CLU79DRAFT_762771 [Phycomyces nitens]
MDNNPFRSRNEFGVPHQQSNPSVGPPVGQQNPLTDTWSPSFNTNQPWSPQPTTTYQQGYQSSGLSFQQQPQQPQQQQQQVHSPGYNTSLSQYQPYQSTFQQQAMQHQIQPIQQQPIQQQPIQNQMQHQMQGFTQQYPPQPQTFYGQQSFSTYQDPMNPYIPPNFGQTTQSQPRHPPVDASALLKAGTVRKVQCPVCQVTLEGDDPAINHHVNEHYN